MTMHGTKRGHQLSKPLARKNITQTNGLQVIELEAKKFTPFILEDLDLKRELEELPETPVDNTVGPMTGKPVRKKRVPIGANGWEDGFKLIRGVYWIRVQRRGRRKCINLRTNSIRVAKERRDALGKMLADEKHFGVRPEVTVGQLWERYAAVAQVRITPKTFDLYRRVWEYHILPKIGDLPYNEITNEVVEQLLSDFLGLYSNGDRESTEKGSGKAKPRNKPNKKGE